MSRTKHHRNQRSNKCGRDFGAKYKCDRKYGGGVGPEVKNRADQERRINDKKIVEQEIREMD